jgi:1-acyl-sn-glycerol-3-phosphate acyltransferase
MDLIRSLLFNAAFFAWSGTLLLIGLPLLLIERQGVRRLGVAWARGTMLLLRVLAGVRVEYRGPRLAGGRVIAAKHQSAFDTFVFYALADDPAYVMKEELTSIPVFGALSRHQRMIVVDRKGGATALKRMLRESRTAIDEHRQIVIFPQGTRTAPGTTAADAPYQPGVAALYQSLGVAVTPVALNSGLHWGRRSFVKRPGRIVIEALPEIPSGLSRPEFMSRLEAAIEDGSRRLEQSDTTRP